MRENRSLTLIYKNVMHLIWNDSKILTLNGVAIHEKKVSSPNIQECYECLCALHLCEPSQHLIIGFG